MLTIKEKHTVIHFWACENVRWMNCEARQQLNHCQIWNKQFLISRETILNNIKRFFRIPKQMLLARFFTECQIKSPSLKLHLCCKPCCISNFSNNLSGAFLVVYIFGPFQNLKMLLVIFFYRLNDILVHSSSYYVSQKFVHWSL